MSAVLQSPSPPTAARAALEQVRSDLAILNSRIKAYEHERDEAELARMQRCAATVQAVSAGAPLPKLKAKPSDADTVLPILAAKRSELTERLARAEGAVRSACVEVARAHHREARSRFGAASQQLVAAWTEVLGTHALLTQAGVTSEPLPAALLGNFSIPALPPLHPISALHWAHFLASHALAQGAQARAAAAARARMEGETGLQLPW